MHYLYYAKQIVKVRYIVIMQHYAIYSEVKFEVTL